MTKVTVMKITKLFPNLNIVIFISHIPKVFILFGATLWGLIVVTVLVDLLSSINCEIKNNVCDEDHSLNILQEVTNYYYNHLWNEAIIKLGAMLMLHIRSVFKNINCEWDYEVMLEIDTVKITLWRRSQVKWGHLNILVKIVY